MFSFGQRHEERVIIISSKDNDEKVTDAEKALEQIAILILKVRSSRWIECGEAFHSHTFHNILPLKMVVTFELRIVSYSLYSFIIYAKTLNSVGVYLFIYFQNDMIYRCYSSSFKTSDPS